MSRIKGKQIDTDTVTAANVDKTGTLATINAGDTPVTGSGDGVAPLTHQHGVATGAATADVEIGDAASEGASSNLAREDHVHAVVAPSAPEDVTKAVSLTGTSSSPAREDHKHDVSTAAAVELTDSTNSEGLATSLARSNHTHAHGARGGATLHSAATPSVAGFFSAADKTKLDSLADASGLNIKATVDVATTVADGDITLSGEQTIDGILTSNSRVLVKNQTDPLENGIYDTAAGAWTRTADFPTGSSQAGAIIPVDTGTLNLDTIWFCLSTSPNDVVDTDAMVFALQAQGAPRMNGAGLQLNGNTLDVGANADGSMVVNADDIQVGVLANDVQHGVRGGGTQHADAIAGAPGTAGFMTGVDKSKLDGLTAGAEPNLTNRQEAITTELIVNSDTALADTLNFTPDNDESLVLFLNGVMQRQGAGNDYSVSGQTITWLASSGTAVNMQTNDTLDATYLS